MALSDTELNIASSARNRAFSHEWLADGQVCCYRLHRNERAVIDVWANELEAVLETWPVERPWRMLIDLREVKAVPSAYGLTRSRLLMRLRPDLPGRAAFLITDAFTTRLIHLTIQALPNRYRERRVFTDEAAAVAWLLADGTITPS